MPGSLACGGGRYRNVPELDRDFVAPGGGRVQLGQTPVGQRDRGVVVRVAVEAAAHEQDLSAAGVRVVAGHDGAHVVLCAGGDGRDVPVGPGVGRLPHLDLEPPA